MLNPFGIVVFLALSGVILVWLARVIPDIYAYHDERVAGGRLRVDIMMLRMAPVLSMRSDRKKRPFRRLKGPSGRTSRKTPR